MEHSFPSEQPGQHFLSHHTRFPSAVLTSPPFLQDTEHRKGEGGGGGGNRLHHPSSRFEEEEDGTTGNYDGGGGGGGGEEQLEGVGGGEMDQQFQFGNPQAQAYFRMQGHRGGGGAKKGHLTATMNLQKQKRQAEVQHEQRLRGRKRGKKNRSSFACFLPPPPPQAQKGAAAAASLASDAIVAEGAAEKLPKQHVVDLHMPSHSEVKRTIEQMPNPCEEALQRLTNKYRGEFPTWVSYLKVGLVGWFWLAVFYTFRLVFFPFAPPPEPEP